MSSNAPLLLATSAQQHAINIEHQVDAFADSMAANTRNATQGARGHNFENINVNDDALALLGDIHVHNVAGLSPQEQEKAARRRMYAINT